MKLILKSHKLPALYSQDGIDATVRVKLFDPTGSWTWYLTEYDETSDIAYGLTNGHDLELGYVYVNELREFRGPLGLGIERDIHFKPMLMSAVRAKLDAGGHV